MPARVADAGAVTPGMRRNVDSTPQKHPAANVALCVMPCSLAGRRTITPPAMATIAGVEQQVRFCTAADGVRLAFAVHGSGPPIVRVATWLTNLERDWDSPVWRHWLEGLGARHTLIRYDERGCGLSDRARATSRSTPGSATCRRSSRRRGSSVRAARRLAGRRDCAHLRGAAPREGHSPRPLRGLCARTENAHARPSRRGDGADLGDPRRLGRSDARPSDACSPCCSCPRARRSRWRGSTTCCALDLGRDRGKALRRPREHRRRVNCGPGARRRPSCCTQIAITSCRWRKGACLHR